MELTERELAVIISCIDTRMMQLKASGDFPEQAFYERLQRKLLDRKFYQIQKADKEK
jgi:hypothetical protein